MRISQLEGRRVALWGWGREGRAAHHAVRVRQPSLPLTLFCSDAEAAEGATLGDALLSIDTQATDERLSAFEIVIKSPGISPNSPAAQSAAAAGTRFIGGTGLWFAEHAGDDGVVPQTFCVTGTKGKSTTTSLLAHLLRAAGHRTGLVGNIGLPLLEVLDPQPAPAFWAVELSSYQTREVARSGAHPQVAVVLNLFPEHLDWHGSEQRYLQDKLALVTEGAPRIAVLNAADPRLAALSLPDSEIIWFNQPSGWHMRGDIVHRGGQPVFDSRDTPLPGRHNRGNLCAVLAAIEALGLDAAALAPAALSFRPLPHRLQTLGTRNGVEAVNDSIATTPHASIAALDCFRGRRVAILVGGYDRGLDWGVFVERIAAEPVAAVITMGQNGPRVYEKLRTLALGERMVLAEAGEMEEAVKLGLQALGTDGVLLLSPGAPSFPRYLDYVARGRHFAELAGFDPDAITAIAGIGIA